MSGGGRAAAAAAQAAATGAGATASRLAALEQRREAASQAGSARRVARQHASGKGTARERLDLLCDPGSFVEFDAFARHRCTDFEMAAHRPYGDGVVTGFATVGGRKACVFAQDFTVFGGSLGAAHGAKIEKVMEAAVRTGCPIIGISDSGGARIQEGVVSLAYYAEIARLTTRASGVVPQISLIMGPCAGGAVYTPAITDFTVMVDGTSHMFVTGPDVVAAVTGQRPSFAELGGAEAGASVAGNVHYLADGEADAVDWVRTLLGFLPGSSAQPPPAYDVAGSPTVTAADRELDGLLPDSHNQAYDMRDVIERVVDDGDLLGVQDGYAPSMICGLARVAGATVAVVANQPLHNAGIIDVCASEKAARFIRFCDAFNIPILTFVDVPGYLPGVEQERLGIIRRGAKLIYAYSEATVPKVTVVVRKAYGGGYAVMGSKHVGGDMNFAWPTAEIAVMGETGAVSVLYARQLGATAERDAEALRSRHTEDYRRRFASPYAAAERGYVDAVIVPSRTRLQVTTALAALRTKREALLPKKHGNIPL